MKNILRIFIQYHLRARHYQESGLGFVAGLVAIVAIAAVAGTTVAIVKSANGITPTLDVDIRLSKGEVSLDVDPEMGTELESEDIGPGEFAEGLFGGGFIENQFLVIGKDDPIPDGFELVESIVDPQLPADEASLAFTQALVFDATILGDTSLPFSADGEYSLDTTIESQSGSVNVSSFANWSANSSGIVLGATDSIYSYIVDSAFSVEGFGSLDLGTFQLQKDQSLTFQMDGGSIFHAARIEVSVPEPRSNLGLLAIGAIGGASILKRKLKSSNSTGKKLEKIS